MQWHFEVQLHFYAVYSRPVKNIANFFAVSEFFFMEKYNKIAHVK